MLRLVRSGPNNASLRSRALKVPRGLGLAPGPIACGFRQMQSTPEQNGPPPPIGLVNFVGFEYNEYVMCEPPADKPEDLQEVIRKRELRQKKVEDEWLQHPFFQPLVSVANAVPVLDLAGALLVEARRGHDSKPVIGQHYLACLHDMQYFDQDSGIELNLPEDVQGRVTLTLPPPSFMVTHKHAVTAGRAYADYIVEAAEADSWIATEAELDQVACTSPYFKMGSFRGAGPLGSSLPCSALALPLLCPCSAHHPESPDTIAAPPNRRYIPRATRRHILAARLLVRDGRLRAADPAILWGIGDSFDDPLEWYPSSR